MADHHDTSDTRRRVHRPGEGDVPLVYWEEERPLLRRVLERIQDLVQPGEEGGPAAPTEPDAEGPEAPTPPEAGAESPPREERDPGILERATLQLLPGRLDPVDPQVIRQEVRFLRTPRPEDGVTLGWDPGRAPYHITLDHPSVQPLHARMRLRDGEWWIESLSYRDPVDVNDERLEVDGGGRRLEDGDRVRIGEAEFHFRLP